jgi:hypothetical protein
MQGELIVVGKDQVHIALDPLNHKRIKHVVVKFKDECEIVPCNPKHFDELSFEVEKIHHKTKLIISWNVSNVRTIEWFVHY